MLSRMREQLGTAGLIVAIVALVAALGGGAYAASNGLTGKQKKEVQKIAKKSGKPGPAGPQGPAGANGKDGSNGSAGAKGDKGDQGTPGTPGTPGTSATTKAFAGSKGGCTEGGIEVLSGSATTFVCNGLEGEAGEQGEKGDKGEKGDPWTAGGTLPPGATETGVFRVQGELKAEQTTPIGWSIPLSQADADAITVTVTDFDGDGATCTGTSRNPTAPPGKICFYIANESELSGFGVIELGPTATTEFGVSPAGALIYIENAIATSKYAEGSFAITAPAAP